MEVELDIIAVAGGLSLGRRRSTDDERSKLQSTFGFGAGSTSRSTVSTSPAKQVAMKVLRACRWFALVLLGACVGICTAHGKNQDPDQSVKSNGQMMNLPMHPGGGPDPYAKYETDSTVGIAARDQERRDGLLRQKQLTEATELLLKVARDLRAEMAANPGGSPTASETERLKLIEKLAHLIQDRERAQDQVSAALAKTGSGP